MSTVSPPPQGTGFVLLSAESHPLGTRGARRRDAEGGWLHGPGLGKQQDMAQGTWAQAWRWGDVFCADGHEGRKAGGWRVPRVFAYCWETQREGSGRSASRWLQVCRGLLKFVSVGKMSLGMMRWNCP